MANGDSLGSLASHANKQSKRFTGMFARRAWLAMLTVSFGAVLWAADAHAATSPCDPASSSQVRHSASGAVVFDLKKRQVNAFGVSHRSGMYACNSRVGAWFPLARSSRWQVDRVYLNGDFAAFTITEKPVMPGGGQRWILRVMNTRTGRYLRQIDFTWGAFITDFAVGRSGSLAYISYIERGGDWLYWVKRRDWRGMQVLDKGRHIGEFSLSRSWTRISWKHGKLRRHDRLY